MTHKQKLTLGQTVEQSNPAKTELTTWMLSKTDEV